MSRPRRTTLDPRAFEFGVIAGQTAVHDQPFPDDPHALVYLLDHVVGDLDEPHRSAVQMCVMAGTTYDEAADMLVPVVGRRVHRRQVWRWAAAGLKEVRRRLDGAPWVSVLMADRIPPPEGQEVPPRPAFRATAEVLPVGLFPGDDEPDDDDEGEA